MAVATGTALMAGASALGPVLGGVIGNMASKGDRERAMAAIAEAQSIIDSVPEAPDLSKIQIVYDQFKRAGVLTPEIETALNLQASKVSQIQEDKSLREAQISALEGIKERGKVGLTPEERAELNKVRKDVQRDVEAKRQQILQNLAARGQAGSGQELASQMLAAQSGAERASEEGDRISAIASQRALQALSQAGQLGGQIRGQDFDVERTRASAEDEIARFNMANAVARQQRNVDRSGRAQELNLAALQRAQDTNTQMINQEKLRQVEAKRQFWQDQLARASARANVRTGSVAPAFQQEAQRTSQMWSGIGSGVGAGAGALGNYMNQRDYMDFQRDEAQKNRDAMMFGRGVYTDTPSSGRFTPS